LFNLTTPAAAFRYMRAGWPALLRCFDDGRLALDNNPAERALRCVALGRKNHLFAGSDAGGRRAAAMYSLIESAKLNGLNPQHYLTDVLTRIADHPARRIAELLELATRRPQARCRLTRARRPPEPGALLIRIERLYHAVDVFAFRAGLFQPGKRIGGNI